MSPIYRPPATPRRAISKATARAIVFCTGVLIGIAATYIGNLFN